MNLHVHRGDHLRGLRLVAASSGTALLSSFLKEMKSGNISVLLKVCK